MLCFLAALLVAKPYKRAADQQVSKPEQADVVSKALLRELCVASVTSRIAHGAD